MPGNQKPIEDISVIIERLADLAATKTSLRPGINRLEPEKIVELIKEDFFSIASRDSWDLDIRVEGNDYIYIVNPKLTVIEVKFTIEI